MPIRRRLTPPKAKGYPYPRFMRYCKRFGEVRAAFINAKMQAISGFSEKVKGPGSPTIEYLNRMAVEAEELEAREQGLDAWADKLHEIAIHWPKEREVINSLPSSAYLY